MTAVVLKQDRPPSENTDNNEGGYYKWEQDPVSGGMIRIWVPDTTTIPNPDGTTTTVGKRIRCSARAIREGGIRVSATNQRATPGGMLDTSDYINFEFGKDEDVTRRDRIVDIRNSDGVAVWREEEGTNLPTVFEVTGVIPVTDPWGKVLKQFTLLERVQDQGAFWKDNPEAAEEYGKA